ncbi:glycosyltransferase family 4 protein [Pseudooctadecabacter jejudonensis]|uniref:GDP-mannose-dependent alpha-(1-6)-phosphatidylinositol monomannoside mannosyltransferase n=1 Tax=Pseudooctadecabacter jejudonensis TaxID=1391910 RepID=A0A1Y5SQY7_9RHOB|nr:glycosyltransferase family 4 protein [Pseudooctadecabacter jejudonensis]SLN45931.1 GDP-mannose-dependent alpha-(1-6)-phosphatidylinositol monomannoside mannosyltransferase [Pseudooctadecabacter jejudonensis]
MAHILITVSEFPKVTETFVLSNALHYQEQGHRVGIFHVKPFRDAEVVHPHARPILQAGFTFGWFDRRSAAALAAETLRAPHRVLGLFGQIGAAFWREPKRLAATLALFPKATALARHCRREGVDHIHAEFAGYPATAAWVAAKLSGVPFSFSAHAHDIFLTQSLLVTKATEASFVRAISHFNRDFLARIDGFPADKICVLRCGVSLPQEVPVPDLQAGQPLRIVFVGALLPRKGVDVLLRALSDLPQGFEWSLDIIGGGSQDASLRKLAATLTLKNVTFHGPQSSDVVRAAMAEAHVVVVPSREGEGGRSEGIPVVLMEALSLARPVITTRLSGIPELVEDGVTGLLCPPDDVDALRAALLRLREDYPAARAMGRRGRERVAEDFDITKTADALLTRILEV